MNKLYLFLLLSVIVLSCSRKPQHHDPVPDHDQFTIESKAVNETRVINVWTPPVYKDGSDSLPVLYMPDGGIVGEDFPHIANTLAQLIENKSIPPIILVGIENTDRRIDLTGFSAVAADSVYCPLTDGAKNYRSFITEELFPEINKRYRTTQIKGIIGESLAGLFVMETFMLAPSSFDFYIAFDPSLWWNDHYLEKNAADYITALPDQPIKLWFAGSDAEDISKHTNAIAKTLERVAPQQLTWTYADEPNEKHHTIFRAAKEKAMIWTMNDQTEK